MWSPHLGMRAVMKVTWILVKDNTYALPRSYFKLSGDVESQFGQTYIGKVQIETQVIRGLPENTSRAVVLKKYKQQPALKLFSVKLV